jgi:hypothetical protein
MKGWHMFERAMTSISVKSGYVEVEFLEDGKRKSLTVKTSTVEEYALRHGMSEQEIERYVTANLEMFIDDALDGFSLSARYRTTNNSPVQG